jgi:hypothetical protein
VFGISEAALAVGCVRPDAATTLDSRGWTLGVVSWRAQSTPLRLSRNAVTQPRSGGRGQAPPRRPPAPAHPVLLHLPGTTGGRIPTPSRRPDTHSDTRPDSRPRWTLWLVCWTARADTLADGHRWADRMAARVPVVVCSRPSVRVGRETNDERPSPPIWPAATVPSASSTSVVIWGCVGSADRDLSGHRLG